MPRALPILLAALLCSGARTLAAQVASTLPVPTLPSDTLEANYAPRTAPAPTPELAPSLPGDTLEATEPVDSFPTEPFRDERSSLEAPGDSTVVRELRSWIEHHRDEMSPPPVRALLVRA